MCPTYTGRGGEPSHSVSPMILVVEDAFVSGFLKTALAQKGYLVICAERAGAVTLLRNSPAIDLLITNIPAAFAECPGLPVLYIAASPELKQIRWFRSCR